MKRSVWIWILIGMFAIVAALIIEITHVILQTGPTATDTGIINVLTVLLITGAVLFTRAFWDWKQEVNKIHVFIPVVIGLVGLGVSIQFWNALVEVFFPKTSIPLFLAINFTAVAMVGVFLSIFGQLTPSTSTSYSSETDKA